MSPPAAVLRIAVEVLGYSLSYFFCISPYLQKRLIAQTKMVLKVLFLYIPLPMFWALFDQQVK